MSKLKLTNNSNFMTCIPDHNLRPKIRPLLIYKGAAPYNREHARQKRIRRYKVLTEHENYPEHPSLTLQKGHYSGKYSHQKYTKRLVIAYTTPDTLLNILNLVKSRYTSLKDIHIAVKEAMKGKLLHTMAHCLGKLSRITKITLAFFEKQLDVRDEQVVKLDKSLSSLKRLTNINITLTENKASVQKQGMIYVGSIFERKNNALTIFPQMTTLLTNLTKINITITDQNTMTDDELDSFSQRIKNLQNLTAVSFGFLDCMSLKYTGLNTLLTNIALLPKLKSLHLGFPVFEYIGKPCDAPSFHPIWKMDHIDHMSIEARLYGIFPADLAEYLGESLIHIKKLEKLMLSFHRAQFVEDIRIKKIMENLIHLPNLRHFNIDFVFCQALHASVANFIMYNLSVMPNLKTASMTFQTCFRKMIGSRSELAGDTDPLKINPSLEKLTLGFVECPELTEYQIIKMTELIKLSPNLKDLSVTLNSCKAVTDEHFQEFMKTISPLQGLEELTIEFPGRFNSAKENLEELKKLHFPLLKHLDLNLSNWTGIIKQEDLDGLGKSLSKFMNLEGLRINFVNWKSITDFAVEKLCEDVRRLKKLNMLTLGWSSTKIADVGNYVASILEKELSKLCYIQLHTQNRRMWMWMNG